MAGIHNRWLMLAVLFLARTAVAFQFPGDFLPRVATRIVNEVKGINRVTYDYTSKPPGTIEWE